MSTRLVRSANEHRATRFRSGVNSTSDLGTLAFGQQVWSPKHLPWLVQGRILANSNNERHSHASLHTFVTLLKAK